MADGLTFEPNREHLPLDWLVADMLIPPGPAFGLLRRWTSPTLTRRLVVNVKLPQEHPWPALKPIVAYLRGLNGWKMEIRQLYHDRREVTVMAIAL
jgi:23S rRNA C2498 (ribose-2'-O)-methylase RlmM